jgi:hypothetical protein
LKHSIVAKRVFFFLCGAMASIGLSCTHHW